MNNPIQNPGRFFKVVLSKQAYLNLLYLLAAFPLGIFYFVFLISGLSTGISLVIIWVGIPILLLVGIAWWGLANLERIMAI
ncbi:MAG: sensor domain-containing protein, partial [Anaerolineales bacterium]|nr:sensor domain-containing protein [Anaerolineales bacterium]